MEENADRVQEQKRVSWAGGWIGSPKEDELPPFNFPIEDKSERIIKVIGVGGGGGNAVQHMWEVGVKNVNFVVVNTDSQVLVPNKVPNKIQLGDGLGAGGDPEPADQGLPAVIQALKNSPSDTGRGIFLL